MQNGPQTIKNWLDFEQLIKISLEKNPGFLFLTGVCLASITFYWIGTPLLLFTGSIAAFITHALYPKQTEKWLKEHEFLFTGGALGYLLGGLTGSLIGLWLGHFLGEKYRQALGVASHVTQALSPVLHPISFGAHKLRRAYQWLRSLVVDSAVSPESDVTNAQDDEHALVLVPSASMLARGEIASISASPSLPSILINFKQFTEQFVRECKEQTYASLSFVLPVMRFPRPFKVSKTTPAIESPNREKERNELVVRENALATRPSMLIYQPIRQKSLLQSGYSTEEQVNWVKNVLSLLSPYKRNRL